MKYLKKPAVAGSGRRSAEPGELRECHAREEARRQALAVLQREALEARMSEQLFHGEVGPELNGVGDRWSPEELRAIVVNSKAIFSEDTIMPGFYSLDVGKDVRKDLVGKTILSAQQVEDVVAYLATLKE